MADDRDKVILILFSFFQPLLSTGAFVLFYNGIYREEFLFPGIYPLVHIVVLLIGVAVFRPYCRKNLYVFEDLETAVNERIIMAIALVSLAATVLSFRLNFRFFLLSIPLGLSLFLSYSISLFHYLQTRRIGGIVRLTQKHIKTLSFFIFYLSACKILFILITVFLDYPPVNLPLAAAGFASDLLLLLFLRANLNRLEIQKEGFSRRRLHYGVTTLLFVISLAASLPARDNSLLSPELLKRFYFWLISLSSRIPLSSGEIEMESSGGGPTPDELKSMHFYWESIAPDFESLRKIFDIIEYVMIALIALLIVYFIFYPVIAPFLFRKKKIMTMREYYAFLFRRLSRFLARIVSFLKSLSGNHLPEREDERKDGGASLPRSLSSIKVSPAKRAEVRTLYKLYGKLRKRGNRRIGETGASNSAVGEFFSRLSGENEEWLPLCSRLAPLFNKSFFSSDRLNRDEWKELKELSSILLKGL